MTPPLSPNRLPLSALLSQTLVALIIEFDNEFEHRMPHSTTDYGATQDAKYTPWLVSMVMWENCLRFVPEEGITVKELEQMARTPTNLNGMERWGYIRISPNPSDTRPKPPQRDWLITATPAGKQAQMIGQPLFAEIESRWRERFGGSTINNLRDALWAVVRQFDVDLPECLTILHYGLVSQAGVKLQKSTSDQAVDSAHLTLPALLSQTLLAFALEFEDQSPLSLAVSANVLRVLDDKGMPLRSLPQLSGVSTEAVRMSVKFLQKNDDIVMETADRVKQIRLTPKGLAAQKTYYELVLSIEESWQSRFGKAAVENLRRILEGLVGESAASNSPLFRGLEPYPDNWRARVRKPNLLPHYPMVLHRGGFPDGS